MDLIVYRNILYGVLKPWQQDDANEKFFRQNLNPDFVNPADPSTFYKALKELLPTYRELYDEDGLEVYETQPDTEVEYTIKKPMINIQLQEPFSATSKFYYYLLQNETTRISNRIYYCFNKDINETNKKELIQNVVKSCKDLLLRIGTDKNLYPTDKLTDYVIDLLVKCIVRLLKEVELLYPAYTNQIKTEQYVIFSELLHDHFESFETDTTTPTFQDAKNEMLQIDDFKLEKSDKLSFGFNGNRESLKSVIIALNRHLYLLNDDKTSSDDLLSVLTSKDLKIGAPQIHLDCETTQFAYIVDKLKSHFHNLTPTSIEQTNLFYSKKGTLLKRNNLYKNKSFYPKEQETIDRIINQL